MERAPAARLVVDIPVCKADKVFVRVGKRYFTEMRVMGVDDTRRRRKTSFDKSPESLLPVPRDDKIRAGISLDPLTRVVRYLRPPSTTGKSFTGARISINLFAIRVFQMYTENAAAAGLSSST